MKNKLLATLVSLTLLLTAVGSVFVLPVSAATSGGYTYTVSNGEATITDYSTSSSYGGAITIPSTLGGYPVTSIGDQAFFNCTKLTSVTIPDSVTSIGNYAFYNCTSLTAVTIPDSVTSIGSAAFYNCTSLTAVTIPDSVTSIGGSAFYNCTSLTSVTIPDSVTSIGNYAFYDCDSLTSVTIPDSVTSIGDSAFYDCTSLTSVTIPDSVTSIGDWAFYNCTSLTSIALPFVGENADGTGTTHFGSIFGASSYTSNANYVPASLKEVSITGGAAIDENAFYGCSSLTSVTIPDSVTSIGSDAFSYCDSLTSINVDQNSTKYCSVDGVLFNKDKTTLIQYPAGKTLTAYSIPDSVTSIGRYAFYSCDSLTSVTIPDSVTSIGNYAFDGCTSLTDVWYVGSEADRAAISIASENTVLIDATWHYNVQMVGDHLYDNICDTTCNICGATRTPPHVFDNACDAVCNECGDTRTPPHLYYNDCDPNCNVCGATRTPPHVFDNACDANCNVCGATRTPPHVFDNACDTTCNACDTTRTTSHQFEWVVDVAETCGETGLKHQECTVCHFVQNENTIIEATGVHTFSNEEDDTCSECSFVKFNVSFNANGGSLNNVPATVRMKSNSLAISTEKPTRSGYIFVGWCSVNTGSKRCTPGATVNVTEATTFYAIWAEKCATETTSSSTCSSCSGKGTTSFSCPSCHFGGKIYYCSTCRRTGNYIVGYGVVKNCSCSGSLTSRTCSTCGGTGKTKCSTCSGSGKIYSSSTCSACSGIGNYMAITWIVDDKITTSQVRYGEYPHFHGSTYKVGDKLYKYVFDGWNKTVVSAYNHAVYVATYTKKYADYQVVFQDWDGTVISSETYHWGDAVTSPADPVRDADAVGVYAFSGWDKTVVDCAGDAVYTATYTAIHSYDNACDEYCNLCGDTRNAPHVYDSVCDVLCNACGYLRTITHDYTDATCTEPKTCSVCGATDGSALGHDYDHACDTACNRCYETRTITHDYADATCTAPKTCKVCGDTVGEKLGHTYSNVCDKSCNRCKAIRSVSGHDYEKKVTKATTTKNGTIKHVCSECGYTSSKVTTIYKASKVSLSKTSYTYNGKAQKPSVTVKDSKGKTISSKYYTVTYASGRKNVGTYKVTVKFKGNYSGTKTLTFKINPAKTTVKSLTAGKKSLKVAITKKSTQVTGYQIQYSTSKSFKSYKTKWLTSYKKTSATLSGLSAKKTYYVRVRTYKKVGGVTYYSGWSTIKYKKTK